MPTYRTVKNKSNPYVMLNKVFLEDPRISYKAKGLLARLLSKPDDWIVYEIELTRAAIDGRDSVRSALKELMQAGYIRRSRQRDDKGMFRQVDYEVHELPVEMQQQQANKSPEDLLLEAFLRAGATEEPTEEVRELVAVAMEQGRGKVKAKARWG